MKNEICYYSSQTDRQRNYGIDLLRIISMLMVVILHILKTAGMLDFTYTALEYSLSYGLEAFCICAVNIFAITSGYVCSGQKFKLSRVVKLWFEVLFYSVIFVFVNVIVYDNFTLKDFLKSFFPVITQKFWYFTAYFLLMLLMPVFNLVIENVDKKNYLLWLMIIGICFSLVTMIFEIWLIYAGYTWVWLAYLYFIGAYLKKYGFKIKKKTIFLIVYLICSLLVVGLNIVTSFLTETILGSITHAGMFYFYSSVFVLVQSIAIFGLFEGLKINEKIAPVVKYLSLHTFGVYLSHSYFISYFKSWGLISIINHSVWLYIPLALFYALIIFCISILLEIARQLLFKILRINKLLEKITNSIQEKIIEKQSLDNQRF